MRDEMTTSPLTSTSPTPEPRRHGRHVGCAAVNESPVASSFGVDVAGGVRSRSRPSPAQSIESGTGRTAVGSAEHVATAVSFAAQLAAVESRYGSDEVMVSRKGKQPGERPTTPVEKKSVAWKPLPKSSLWRNSDVQPAMLMVATHCDLYCGSSEFRTSEKSAAATTGSSSKVPRLLDAPSNATPSSSVARPALDDGHSVRLLGQMIPSSPTDSASRWTIDLLVDMTWHIKIGCLGR